MSAPEPDDATGEAERASSSVEEKTDLRYSSMSSKERVGPLGESYCFCFYDKGNEGKICEDVFQGHL